MVVVPVGTTGRGPATTTSLSERQVELVLVRALRAWRQRTHSRAEFAERLRKLADQLEASASRDAQRARAVFDHWVRATGRNAKRTKFTPQRRDKVRARLREGYTLEEICQAIDSCARDPFNQGDNDRGRRFDDLELICRNATKLEQFRDRELVQEVQEVGYSDPGW